MNPTIIRPYTSRILKTLGASHTKDGMPIQKIHVKRFEMNELSLQNDSVIERTRTFFGKLKTRFGLDASKIINFNIKGNGKNLKIRHPYKDVNINNGANVVIEKVKKVKSTRAKNFVSTHCGDVLVRGTKEKTVNIGNKTVQNRRNTGVTINISNDSVKNFKNLDEIQNQTNMNVENLENSHKVTNNTNFKVSNIANKEKITNRNTQNLLINKDNFGLVDNLENNCTIANHGNRALVINPKEELTTRIIDF